MNIFLPIEKDYIDILKSRETNHKCEFTQETRKIIKKLFTIIIENEADSELWRCKLNRIPMFNTRLLFESVIKCNDQNILFSDLENYFDNLSNEELLIVISIFDKNRDNKISYHEVKNINLFSFIMSYSQN